MIKKIICLLGIIVASCINLFSATITVSNLKFEIDEINKIAICSGPSDIFVALDNLLIPNDISYNDISYPVVAIASKAFIANTKIKGTLTIGDNIECIDSEAFRGCTGLSSVQGGKNIKIIGKYAFYNCRGISTFQWGKNIEIIEDYAFFGCNGLTDPVLNLGEKLQKIGNYAFRNCNISGTLILPPSLKYINSYAFADNSFNGELVLPTNLIEIGDHAFEANLFENVVFNNKLKRIGQDVFNNKYLPNLYLKGELILPKSLIEIGKYAFAYQSQFTNIKFGNNVEIIGTGAFEYCSSLKEVFIPNSVKVIYAYAFCGCIGLETLIIGTSLEKFGGEKSEPFNGSKVSSSEMGHTFYLCPLTTIKCLSPTPPESITWSDGNYSNFQANSHLTTPVYVPKSAIGSYRKTNDWNRFDNIFPLNEDDLKLGEISGDELKDDNEEEQNNKASFKEKLYLQQSQELDLTQYVTSEEINEWICTNHEIVKLDAEQGTISALSYGETKVRGKDIEGNVVAVFDIYVCPTVAIEYNAGKTSYIHHVIYDSTPSLYIAAPEGYEIAGVSHDGVDVTETVNASDGYYIPASPIKDNTVISVTLNSTTIPSDLNGDGKVDSSDLNWLLEQMMNY